MTSIMSFSRAGKSTFILMSVIGRPTALGMRFRIFSATLVNRNPWKSRAAALARMPNGKEVRRIESVFPSAQPN